MHIIPINETTQYSLTIISHFLLQVKKQTKILPNKWIDNKIGIVIGINALVSGRINIAFLLDEYIRIDDDLKENEIQLLISGINDLLPKLKKLATLQ